MGRIIVTEYASLDGVIEAPGGVEDYRHVNWAMEYTRGEQADEFKMQETRDCEALLLGRITYDGFAISWPHMKGEFADRFNTMPKYVVSSTLTDPEWHNTTVLRGDAVDAVSRLRDRIDGNVVVHGSGQLVQALLPAGLVDELRIMVYPVVLGSGKRLFGPTEDKVRLERGEVTEFGDGITLLTYRPATG